MWVYTALMYNTVFFHDTANIHAYSRFSLSEQKIILAKMYQVQHLHQTRTDPVMFQL